jgi:hypothetical protein
MAISSCSFQDFRVENFPEEGALSWEDSIEAFMVLRRGWRQTTVSVLGKVLYSSLVET